MGWDDAENLGLFQWAGGLRIAGSPWYLDSRWPRRFSFVSHAHSDHLPGDIRGEPSDTPPAHGTALCTPATAAIGRYRCGLAAQVIEREYGQPVQLDRNTSA